MVHLSGSAGSGKTLLATALAAKISRDYHVDWLSTDGKTGFIDYLKRNMNHYGGLPSNLTVTRTTTSSEALTAVLETPSRIKPNSRLVVVDPITRVLDMARNDDVLWGRTLFEESLPTLAGTAEANSLLILIISEVRENEFGSQAVYHKKIKPWVVADYVLERPYSRLKSHILSLDDNASNEHVASIHLNEHGEVIVGETTSSLEVS
ncbi:MAG: hypothetical protein ACFFF4_12560 [Candidatus Thorarchaeota archaeon]